MKKFRYLVASLLFVALASAVLAAGKSGTYNAGTSAWCTDVSTYTNNDTKSLLTATVFSMVPHKSYDAKNISYTAGYWSVVDRAGAATVACGISVVDTSSGGNLVVHLIGDYDANGAAVYDTLKLTATYDHLIGLAFDKVQQNGTTIPLGGLKIFLP